MRTLALPLAAIALLGASDVRPSASEARAIVTLAPIAVGIADSGRMAGQLHATLAVEGADGDLLARRVPVLRAAVLGELNEFARLHASPYAPVDAALLSASITAAAKRAVPEADGVLILQLAARPA